MLASREEVDDGRLGEEGGREGKSQICDRRELKSTLGRQSRQHREGNAAHSPGRYEPLAGQQLGLRDGEDSDPKRPEHSADVALPRATEEAGRQQTVER